MTRPVWTVARSEFLRRVRSKWFLIGTLVAPLGLLVFMGIAGAMGYAAMTSGGAKRVAVVDGTGRLGPRLVGASDGDLAFALATDEAAAKAAVAGGTADGYLLLPPTALDAAGEATYVSEESGGMLLTERLTGALRDATRAERVAAAGIAPDVAASLDRAPKLSTVRVTAEGTAADGTAGSYALGFGMGIAIYIVVLIYGQTVMQGVLEEKQSRILEVMASAVRPYDLLMGKVLGIGAVGLVQMAAWVALAAAGTAFAGAAVGAFVEPSAFDLPAGASNEQVLQALDLTVPTFSPGLLAAFLVFFLGGYLLYASLFAAIGSAVEQTQDAQGLTVPVMLPIVLSFVGLQFVLNSPSSPGSAALSMVPFLSSVMMPARMAVAPVPLWQVLGALVLLGLAFVGAIWVSARVYRIGILSYGKKPTLADLARWVRTA